MKLKFITLWGILSISSIGFIMSCETEVKMPDAETLKARLDYGGFQSFAKRTDIVEQLANQKKNPLDLLDKINASIDNYNEAVDQDEDVPPAKAIILTGHLKNFKRYLFEALFKDEQETLKKLKQLGIC